MPNPAIAPAGEGVARYAGVSGQVNSLTVQPNPGNVMLVCNSEKTPNGPWRG
jgi:hypothetical protein